MRVPFGAALALSFILVASAANATENAAPHHRHTGHHPARPAAHQAPAVQHQAPAADAPALTPFRPGEGNTNGLSRDPDDCDTGCIGGNPG
jgi:hypothetical protein